MHLDALGPPLVIGKGIDDVTKRQQPHVDVDALLHASTLRLPTAQ
jgi:hypothetical protein